MTSACLEQEIAAFSAPSRGSVMLKSISRGLGTDLVQAVPQGASFIVTLAKWRAATLKSRGPIEITCLSGQLWITQLGDLRDTVLQAGQRHAYAQAVRDIVLSTAGSPYPATFEIVARPRTCAVLWRLPQRNRPYFELAMP